MREDLCVSLLACFDFADLLLNLSPEFVRVRDPAESFERPACAPHVHASKAKHSTEARLIDTDAFDLWQEHFDALSTDKPCLDKYTLV